MEHSRVELEVAAVERRELARAEARVAHRELHQLSQYSSWRGRKRESRTEFPTATTNSESEPYPFFCAVCCGDVGSPTFTVRSSTPPTAAARRCWPIPSLPPPSPSHGRASASPTFHARATAGRGDVPTCCHHDAAICSYDLLLLTAVIDYVLANAQKPSSMICAQFRPCRREHGRRAPHGHLQAGFARRVRRQSRRGEAPRLAAELVCEACRLAGQR